MRHGDKIKNLGRTQAHRKALLSNLACQLFEHKRITTTLAKAKALRVYAEPLITRCKTDSTHNRRIIFGYLQEKEAIKELFGTISDKVADRPGGYTRIIKLPRRAGDAADMAMIELVDFNTIYGAEAEEAQVKKTRRSRRGGKAGGKNTDEQTTETEATPSYVAEEPVAEHTPEYSHDTEEPASDHHTETEEPTAEHTTEEEAGN